MQLRGADGERFARGRTLPPCWETRLTTCSTARPDLPRGRPRLGETPVHAAANGCRVSDLAHRAPRGGSRRANRNATTRLMFAEGRISCPRAAATARFQVVCAKRSLGPLATPAEQRTLLVGAKLSSATRRGRRGLLVDNRESRHELSSHGCLLIESGHGLALSNQRSIGEET